jgi:lysozyme
VAGWRDGIATLKAGTWRYEPGMHGYSQARAGKPGYPYPAFVQADEVTCTRDNTSSTTGYFGINIHRGSNSGTSSLGCQTVPPNQWEEFHGLLVSRLSRWRQAEFSYVLFEGQG